MEFAMALAMILQLRDFIKDHSGKGAEMLAIEWCLATDYYPFLMKEEVSFITDLEENLSLGIIEPDDKLLLDTVIKIRALATENLIENNLGGGGEVTSLHPNKLFDKNKGL